MNREQYLAKRQELLAKLKGMIGTASAEDYAAVKKEIEDLDAKWDEQAQAQADYNALMARNVVADVQGIGGAQVTAAAVVGSTGNAAGEDAMYEAAFAKTLMGKPLSQEEQAAFDRMNPTNEASTTENNEIFIPHTTMKKIWEEMGELHPLIADTEPGRTYVKGTITIPKAHDPNDAAWYDEDTATADPADGSYEYGSVTLVGKELSKSVTISWKLRDMAVDEFLAFVRRKIAEKMANAWAAAIASGKGNANERKPEPWGIITRLEEEDSTPRVIPYPSTGITYDLLVEAMGKMSSGYTGGAAVYAKNADVWNLLAKIKDDSKRPLFVPDVTAAGVGRLFGRPVKEEDGMPEGYILIGNAGRGYVSNVNRSMTVTTEEHAKQRNTDHVGYMIVDGDVIDTKAFVLLKPAT